ncbi:hypothetical protein TOPH_00427 [Tolypocladium ophioglossoides CBS 100239]|uniref:Uncharacterized protein n=1 Tax=Tolypocladium ophioglossoides (strain CBS 100239) TaxID=1163406 RepID=A0A0L0NLS7_TOLOC|nr:hypothetical protein TOPH_00427 [Tolypocladium ophioglossoides CBS 100239]
MSRQRGEGQVRHGRKTLERRRCVKKQTSYIHERNPFGTLLQQTMNLIRPCMYGAVGLQLDARVIACLPVQRRPYASKTSNGALRLAAAAGPDHDLTAQGRVQARGESFSLTTHHNKRPKRLEGRVNELES